MGINNTMHTIVRRLFEEGWNSANPAAPSDIVHQHYSSNDGPFREVSNVPGQLDFLHGLEAFAEHVRQYRVVYDNLRFDIVRMLADNDTVVTVWNPSGTTKDLSFINRGGQEQPYELQGQGVSLTKIVNGKVRQHDMFWPRNPLFP